MNRDPIVRALACAAWLAVAALPALAETDEELAEADRISALERKVDVLTSELERTRADMAVPETADQLESFFGLGPGASRVYGIARGLSVGGYAEGFYSAFVGDKGSSGAQNRADFLRGVVYVGYKFTDRIIFNMELEFEHASTSSTESSSGGSASVEFATLDFLGTDEINARMGLVLVPMGFLNEIHEPPFFYGVNRPDSETRIIPSTWRENGLGLFGTIAEQIDYRFFVVNGLNGKGFRPSGLRGGRQKGNRALAEDLAFVGRVDFTPIPELTVGGSVYVGNSGQNQTVMGVGLPDVLTTIWELHADGRVGPVHARGLFTMAHLSDAAELSTDLAAIGEISAGQAIAEEMLGGYGEIGVEVLQFIWPTTEMTLEPFVRVEYVDTQYKTPAGFANDGSQEITTTTTGLHFQPIRNVVLKLDYRNQAPSSGKAGDSINVGMGLVF